MLGIFEFTYLVAIYCTTKLNRCVCVFMCVRSCLQEDLCMSTYACISVRNKTQKLVGCFLENQTFFRILINVPLKMYSKFGQPKWILVGQMLKWPENGQWPAAISTYMCVLCCVLM